MATLQFKGKNIIWNHHMSVPYHTLDLDEKLSYKQDKADGNLIVEGDNLPALKSLLPQYTGKIDCIYIDPPYNTGEEGWVYNDNVNSPLIKEWIGNVVGKDDLTKHDKWLSMMTPRLKLIRELLSEQGLVFISIDENENYNLRALMNDIFIDTNFLAEFVWQKKYGGGNDSTQIATEHEFVLVYAKDKTKVENWLEPHTEKYLKRYSEEDSVGRYFWDTLERPGLNNPIEVEIEYKGKKYKLLTFRSQKTIDEGLENGDIRIVEYDKRVSFQFKQRLREGKKPRSILRDSKEAELNGMFELVGSNSYAKKELREYFTDDIFSNPKPTPLIKYLLRFSTSKNSYILDAFAGSGTTAQAVLELNEEDEGNRKFILIQMPENSEKEPKKNIARDITRERVVKVIEKKLKNKDVGFEYRRVGQPIDAETILSGQLPTYKQLAKYVYYLATGQSPKDKDIDEKKFLAGKVDHTEVYLLYTPDMEELKKMAITFEWAKEMSEGNENKKIVYAPACFMDDEYLEQFNIKFVSIPYNLFEREK